MDKNREASVFMREFFARPPTRWNDGRILQEAIYAHGGSGALNDFNPAPYMPHMGSGAQKAWRKVNANPLSPAEWFEAVLSGDSVPTGKLTHAVCNKLNIAPHELMQWSETGYPVPDFIVEAEMFYLQEYKEKRKAPNLGVKAFIEEMAKSRAEMGRQYVSNYNNRTNQEMLDHILDSLDMVWQDVVFHSADDIEGSIAMFEEAIADGINSGQIGTDVTFAEKEREETYNKSQKTLQNIRIFAEMLTSTGKDKKLIEDYSKIVRDVGHARAIKLVTEEPDEWCTLRYGWRHSAVVRMNNGTEIRGQEVLEKFCNQYESYTEQLDSYKKARAHHMAKLGEQEICAKWAKTGRAQAYVRATAQFAWMILYYDDHKIENSWQRTYFPRHEL